MKNGVTVIMKKKYKNEDLITALLFIAPLMIGLFIFYLFPMIQNVYYSFTEWGKFGGSVFIGLENFKKMVSDVQVREALKNTVTYAIFTVPIGIAISIIIATLLNNKIKGVGLYRVIYFLPAVTMTSAIAMIWKWMFNNQYGVINQLLLKIGIIGPKWLTDEKWAMISLITVGVWSSLGQSIILYLAGLQSVPRSLYEASEIDGAGTFRKFFSITLPMITPTIFFNMITSLIGALQVYDLIFLMYSETNPALQSVQSLSYLFYRHAFVFNDKGYAAAISVVLLSITLLITVIQFMFQKKWVHY
ncbi:carbohydrate ABC transporter permease [Vagococcus lutrae]|uniref:carbohydrate ABC transporter permease n=1 Tax=Vagococcus lutrae TaxID=81947 RepID=UPI00200CC513|nr:sugar ABC transporter permease [Vagococcus lutrae]UQF12359.1 sugar ABC transporter permease [Vagococcus lutrae]WEB80829.1 sugar ABC transporter permease [Vagococcus lutrae]